MTHGFSCGMSSFACQLGAVFARESTHRGSVWRHSAASPQELFACPFHRALLVSTAVCGWDVVLFESVPALPCAALAPQLCGYHLRCVGPCFQGLSGRRLHGVHLDRAPWPYSCRSIVKSSSPSVSLSALVRGCVHPRGHSSRPRHVSLSAVSPCEDTPSSWHSMTESERVCSAGAAALANSSTATSSWQSWEGGTPRHSPPVCLKVQNYIAMLMMPAASGYSSIATSRWQSWDGGTPRLSPPVALCHAGM